MNTVDLKQQHIALTLYLKAKLEAKDWHAVSDAANDIRVLEKEIEVLTRIENGVELGSGKPIGLNVFTGRGSILSVAETEEPNECSGSKTSGCGNKGGTK